MHVHSFQTRNFPLILWRQRKLQNGFSTVFLPASPRSLLRFCSSSSTPTKSKASAKPDNLYSSTVLLPVTEFDQRANAIKTEPEIQKYWDENQIYERLLQLNKEGPTFTLHDGPPYANGDLHIGHALNKILKDFINRYKMLQGYQVCFRPGWDCHGLPIEIKVLQKIKDETTIANKKKEKNNQNKEGKEETLATSPLLSLSPEEIRRKAASFAIETMKQQRLSFQRYGVWGDWSNPYLTLDKEYEANQIKVFGKMFEKGIIYRGRKPVHWSPSSHTALAEAELEYPENHISRTIYMNFLIVSMSDGLKTALSSSSSSLDLSSLSLTIWTTTPWTIPANKAIAINPSVLYSVVSHPSIMDNNAFLVANESISRLEKKFGLKKEEGQQLSIHCSLLGKDLVGTTYQHPLLKDHNGNNGYNYSVIAGGDYITTETGTGLVHTAPGHGQEDYQVGLKTHLDIFSPVDDYGKYTKEVGIEELIGLEVLGKGNEKVISLLNESKAIIVEEAYSHKYPYDWRTKKPTIFRATEQWFASVESYRSELLKSVDTVKWIPLIGKNRISSMIENREDWCISRQRSWGVPIPVFYHKETEEPLLNAEVIAHIESIFRQHGSDTWWTMSVEELLPKKYQENANQYRKGYDTMDVWFDSGSSWAAVLKEGALQNNSMNFPADLYLEGSDQSRGWFQSSLLTAVACEGIAPYKTVLTHGFVLDEKGYKMSKSLGNVIDPQIVIEGNKTNLKEFPSYGADTLRLWVAGVDYMNDVHIGKRLLQQTSESYRKIRNTIRFMLGALHGFNPISSSSTVAASSVSGSSSSDHVIPYDQLPAIDKYILGQYSQLLQQVEEAYHDYSFFKVINIILYFLINDLSSFYLDISKDRLYISNENNYRRKSCQTTINIILNGILTMIAPILPHLAEEAYQKLPYTHLKTSIFEKGWFSKVSSSSHYPVYETERFENLRLLKATVNKAIEIGRKNKIFGASLDSMVYIYSSDPQYHALLDSIKGDSTFSTPFVSTNGIDDLRFFLLVSRVIIVKKKEEISESCSSELIVTENDGEKELVVGVAKAKGGKCQRCWFYCEDLGGNGKHVDLCNRCSNEIVEGKLL
jgi:isoleucyl-tRNA synthetase